MQQFLIAFLLLFVFQSGQGKEPSILYLTYTHDPSTSISIHWHTPKEQPATFISYREETAGSWQTATGTSQPLSGISSWIQIVELSQLQPNHTYLFKVGKEKTIHRFRTLPLNLERPVRIAIGGDIYLYFSLMKKMSSQVLKQDPDFVIIGGDIVYAHGIRGMIKLFKKAHWEEKRWQTFLEEWTRQMVTSDGRIIPLLPLPGNHDVPSIKKMRTLRQPEQYYFYKLFPMREKNSYQVIDVGKEISLFLLDSGHVSPIAGQQTIWLEKALKEREHVLHKVATYHIAAFPSVYNYESAGPTLIRNKWVPLFDQYSVKLAFEHHNHAFKRTFPIKGGKIDLDNGTHYLGDGAWGVNPRSTKDPYTTWYLAKAKKINCFWLATMTQNSCVLEAISLKGNRIDTFSVTTKN